MSKYKNLSKEKLLEIAEQQDKELQDPKKYGLFWDKEKIVENVVADCENNLPVLKRIKDKEIQTNNGEDNILIEGDNYHSLNVLNYTHRNKIDVIYIDPPYNTGNKTEWKYNDKYIDKNDGYRHSKWLNMMEKRLSIAKKLIKPGGSIFISIGDDEHANLKLLCDRIFGEENFITNISRIAKTASNLGRFFAPSCDYVLLYTKQADSLEDDSFTQDVNEDLYKKEDEFGKYRDDIALYQSSLKDSRPNQRYFIECPDGSFVIPPGKTIPKNKEDGEIVLQDNGDKRWRWSVETYLQKKDYLVFKETKSSPLIDQDGNQAKYNIYTKSYLNERKDKGTKPRNFLIGKEFLNRKGADYIKKLGIDFNYSKPKSLIRHLIELSNADNEAIILDFFAGSGTTGEVVLDMNNDDNGKRKFILCTNNEVGYKDELDFKKINKISDEGFLNLSKDKNKKYLEFVEKNGVATSVCYPRLKKIIKGYKEVSKKSPMIKGLGGNLKYFKTDFVKKTNNRDQLKINLTKKCTEILCLKENIFNLKKDKTNYKIFTSNDETKHLCIYFNFIDKDFDNFIKEISLLNGEKSVYVFALNNKIDKSRFEGIEDISFEAIPHKILEVYEQLVKISKK
jgi:adenine-specific DNA-methyltransferase